jgi:hypothetical protein
VWTISAPHKKAARPKDLEFWPGGDVAGCRSCAVGVAGAEPA